MVPDRIKKLIYNANHRGMKEVDTLLGKFAIACAPNFREAKLLLFEQLLAEQDADILSWCMGHAVVPAHYRLLMIEILAFYRQER